MSTTSKKSNVIDSPLKRGGKDSLGVDSHVKSLVEFIGNAQMPTTLAIQGEWGSGKTSLMNQLSHNLCEMSDDICKGEKVDDKAFYGIWLNTWQYSLMKSPEETLLAIIKKITDEVVAIIEKRHPNKNNTEKVQKFAKALFKMSLKAAVAKVGGDATIIEELSNNEESSEVSPLVFRDALAEAIDECLKKDGEKKTGFLFFIDDLDRLDPPVAVQILEILKNLFEVDNCIFILAIDYDVVVKGLEPKFGKLTEKNEREFRSFFDKIIQIPFNMPVSRYKIGDYLAEPLEDIGFFDKAEMKQLVKVTSENEKNGKENTEEKKLSEVLEEMIKLSTGYNPRSIKRLINTLSLIKIMNSNAAKEKSKEEDDNVQLNLNNRLLTFGLICVQISYPLLYNFLEQEPDIENWDEDIATRHNIKALDEEVRKKIHVMPEFDEPWEKILYRFCLRDKYLEVRAPSASKLLSLIWDIIEEDDAKKAITQVLGVTSVTSVNTSEANNAKNEKTSTRIRFDTIEECLESIAELYEKKITKQIKDMTKEIVKEIESMFPDTIRIEFHSNNISIYHRFKRHIILRLQPFYEEEEKPNRWLIYWKINTKDGYISTLEQGEEYSLPQDFYDKVKSRHNKRK